MTGAHLLLLLDVMTEHRDEVIVLAATGWHTSELERFIASGRIDQHERTGEPVLWTKPKGKKLDERGTIVSQKALAAAERLRDSVQTHYRNLAPSDVWKLQDRRRKAIHDSMKAATQALREKFPERSFEDHGPGDLRHTVSTFATIHGDSREAAAAFVGNDPKTNERHYSGTAPTRRKGRKIAPKVPTPI